MQHSARLNIERDSYAHTKTHHAMDAQSPPVGRQAPPIKGGGINTFAPRAVEKNQSGIVSCCMVKKADDIFMHSIATHGKE